MQSPRRIGTKKRLAALMRDATLIVRGRNGYSLGHADYESVSTVPYLVMTVAFPRILIAEVWSVN
jgi:hypothetical protein